MRSCLGLPPRAISICGPAAAGVCIDICCLNYHRSPNGCRCLNYYKRPCGYLRAVLLRRTCCSEWPALPPELMGTSGLKLLLGAISGSVILWQLGPVLMSQAHTITKSHVHIPGLDCCLRHCAELPTPHTSHHTQ